MFLKETTVWNNLPTDIRSADLFMNFHSLLRNHFYRLSFTEHGHISPRTTIRHIMSTYWPINKNI